MILCYWSCEAIEPKVLWEESVEYCPGIDQSTAPITAWRIASELLLVYFDIMAIDSFYHQSWFSISLLLCIYCLVYHLYNWLKCNSRIHLIHDFAEKTTTTCITYGKGDQFLVKMVIEVSSSCLLGNLSLIWDVIKQNELEVGSDMLLVSEVLNHLNIRKCQC